MEGDDQRTHRQRQEGVDEVSPPRLLAQQDKELGARAVLNSMGEPENEEIDGGEHVDGFSIAALSTVRPPEKRHDRRLSSSGSIRPP